MKIPVYHNPEDERLGYTFEEKPGWLKVDPETHEGPGFTVIQFENKDLVMGAVSLAMILDDHDCLAWSNDQFAFLISREYWETFDWVDKLGVPIP